MKSLAALLTFFSVLLLGIPLASLAQEVGSHSYPSSDPKLFKPTETPIFGKMPSLRKPVESGDTAGYSAYPPEPAEPEVAQATKKEKTETIPPPPIEIPTPEVAVTEPEPEVEMLPPEPAEPKPEPVIRPKPAPVIVKARPVTVRNEAPRTPEPEIRAAAGGNPSPSVAVEPSWEAPATPPSLEDTFEEARPVEPRPMFRSRPPAPATPTPSVVVNRPRVNSDPFHSPHRIERPVRPPVATNTPPRPKLYVNENEGGIRPSRTISNLRAAANTLAGQGIKYQFGRNHPTFGGLDSSGSIQHLLSEIGVVGVPRTIGGQVSWLRMSGTLHNFSGRPSPTELERHLEPGNLIFWGDYRTGRINHVMIYTGYDAQRRRHLAFGTRAGIEVGLNGHEVDIFDLKLDRERIIATGAVPGLGYRTVSR